MPISPPPDTIEQRAALIRAQYPAGDLPALAKQLGVSMNRLMTLACRLGVKRDKFTAGKGGSRGQFSFDLIVGKGHLVPLWVSNCYASWS